MLTRTKAQLLADVKEHYDVDSSYITDSVFENWIQKEGAMLHGILVQHSAALYADNPEPYITTVDAGEHSVSIGENSFNVPKTQNLLPDDHLKTRHVRFIRDDGTVGRVRFMNDQDWHSLNTTNQTVVWNQLGDNKVYMRETDRWFYFGPPPDKQYTVEIFYATSKPFETPGTGAKSWTMGVSEVLRLPMDWFDYIVYGVCMRAAIKEETDERTYEKLQNKVLQNMLETLQQSRNEIPAEIAEEWDPEEFEYEPWA